MRRENLDENVAESPRATANWLSAVTFAYLLPLFREGKQRDLDERDLTKCLDEHKSGMLGDKLSRLWSEEVEYARRAGRKPSMVKVIIKCFIKDTVLYGAVLASMELFVRIAQPLFLGLLLRYFSPSNEENNYPIGPPMYFNRLFNYWLPTQCAIQRSEAYVFGIGIILTTLITVLVLHPYMLAVMHIGMKMRVACCSLLYRKCLRISYDSLGGQTVGNVVNLMSNDVNRFDIVLLFFHYLWISPMQVIMIMYFLYREMGVSGFMGMISVFVFIPLQAWFGKVTSIYRLKTALRTDSRVRQMNEIIQGIQVIKMYTWEYAFSKMIYKSRRSEIRVLRYTSYVRGMIMSFIMFTTRSAMFITIFTYILFGNYITAEKVFVITAFYNVVRQTMTVFFPQGVAQIAESHVAISRIRRFMLTEETEVGDPTPIDPNWQLRPHRYNRQLEALRAAKSIDVDEVKFVVIRNVSAKYGDEICLRNINLSLKASSLTALIGQVGSGKSCIMNLILGELLPYEGIMSMNGTISYAAQEPWLFAGSVRQNILFGRPYDRARYQRVTKVCALSRDFTLLPYGDQTIIGERGISLSGGQRARVNLARAVYKQADIYLLDDPLSAVDTQVGKQIFDECITSFLNDKIVLLATHQLQYLKQVGQIVIMGNGRLLGTGTYTELVETGLNFAKLLEEQLTVDEEDEESKAQAQLILTKISTKSGVTASVVDMEGKFEPHEVAEMRTYGSVEGYIYKEYFRAGGNWFIISSMWFMFLFTQILVSSADYFVLQWVKLEEQRHFNRTYLEGIWTNLTRMDCIVVYTIIISLIVVSSIGRSMYFFTVAMSSSVNLHNRMFESICHASMRFFNTNTSGRILNRFSKDLGAIDEFLPNAMLDTVQIMLNLVGISSVVCIVKPILIIPTVVVIGSFVLLRRYYLCTSRSVKRLEAITRSPVFAHLNATLQGLTTIRSNGAEVVLTSEFDKYQDVHSSAWYLFIATSRAFGYWLDAICALYVGIITVTYLFIDLMGGVHGGEVGLSVTQCISLTALLQYGMRQSAELENQMTSVERVLEFTRVEHEAALESEPDKKPPPDWPQEGKIEFVHATMRYSLDEEPVLKDLSFTVAAKEKIGIVGRTGAGKSSLIAALFRLAYFEGTIFIDGVDIGRLGLHDLRRKISIIPQEPVLFSGTMRYNLDPFGEYPDEDLISALLVVEIIPSMDHGSAYLEHEIVEGGANLSVGQRQLVCLARAIIRNNCILVMDEATANVDGETDKFIQETIRAKFDDCTVLTIAHRLNTVMDSDRVLVMDAGLVVELDHPHILLQDPDGFLSRMVERTGTAMADHLKKVAHECYIQKFGAP